MVRERTARELLLEQDSYVDGLGIAKGDVPKHSVIHKFGEATNIQSNDGFVDIWDGAGNTNASKTYTFSTTADIDSLSSSDDTDTQDIEVEGLDTNYDLVTQTITLTGQTGAPLTTALLRVFRMKNVGTTDLAGDVYCYVNGAITTGIPDTNADIRAIVENGNNQTLMAIYTIPNGKTGYMNSFYVSLSRSITTVSSYKVRRREVGGVFQLKHIGNVSSSGSSVEHHEYGIPEQIPAKTDIIISANSTNNNNGVAAGFDIILVDD